MAFFEFKNVRIAGFSAGVPASVVYSDDKSVQSADYDAAAFVEMTGIKQRRYSELLTTSDLCFHAAEKLIQDLKWDRSDIEVLIFVSQTADYILPATSCILQDRLGLSKECYAADISLGCSGWVYGLSNVVSLLHAGSVKKALLLVGDGTRLHAQSTPDPLFGAAGTATALEFREGAKGFQFHLGTDGSGFEAIIMPDGGSRNQASPQSFELEEFEGRKMHRMEMRMKGMDVFSFGISVPPKSIKKLAERYAFDYQNTDYFVFHQSNMTMLEKIRSKLNIASEKVPYSLPYFGNTSSGSIPMTIVSELKGKIETKPTKFICCGFGVGLSWGSVAFETENIVISDLVEIND